MKYTKEDRLEIGRRIYNGELSKYQACEKYNIGMCTARDYMRLYRDANELPPMNDQVKRKVKVTSQEVLNEFNAMSREELIIALFLARSREYGFQREELIKSLLTLQSSELR